MWSTFYWNVSLDWDLENKKGETNMNAQLLLDTCNTQEFNPKRFRQEINISGLLNDTVAEFKRQEDIRNIYKLSSASISMKPITLSEMKQTTKFKGGNKHEKIKI